MPIEFCHYKRWNIIRDHRHKSLKYKIRDPKCGWEESNNGKGWTFEGAIRQIDEIHEKEI